MKDCVVMQILSRRALWATGGTKSNGTRAVRDLVWVGASCCAVEALSSSWLCLHIFQERSAGYRGAYVEGYQPWCIVHVNHPHRVLLLFHWVTESSDGEDGWSKMERTGEWNESCAWRATVQVSPHHDDSLKLPFGTWTMYEGGQPFLPALIWW